MNTTSVSPADQPSRTATGRPVLVWDAPVRLTHWLMVFSFAGAYLTAESEHWRLVHVTLGYTLAGLVGFRVLWGFFGTRYARFANFVRGPAAVADYLRDLLARRPPHHVGHNPAGALAILVLLGLAALVTGTGWATYEELGGKWLEELHEGAANLMLAVVGVHVAGVLVSGWLHGDNLVGAMITGHKPVRPEDGVRRAWRGVAALLLAAVLAFWALQWWTAPTAGSTAGPTVSARHNDRDDD
ncbi:MAG TPA: cytochrome b/b6 domain-containing protein [Burkholderiaceae bacterium]|nr:cytochrome b/b6 domain-containing protein [Burkholderiaceae bacterium]